MAISSDWGTAKLLVKEQLGRARNIDDDMIGAELANAINFYRGHDFWFLRQDSSFALVADQAEYAIGASPGPASDVVRIIKARVQDASDSNLENPCEEVTLEQLRRHQQDAYTLTRWPEVFAWTFTAGDSVYSIEVSPAPDDAHTFAYDYIADIGTPGVKKSGSSINVTDPDDRTTEISDTYSNFWFTRAMELITARALAQLYLKFLHNSDAYQVYKIAEAEAKRQVENHGRISAANTLTPYFC